MEEGVKEGVVDWHGCHNVVSLVDSDLSHIGVDQQPVKVPYVAHPAHVDERSTRIRTAQLNSSLPAPFATWR